MDLAGADRFACLRRACLELVVLELENLPAEPRSCFTRRELVRAEKMGPRRLLGFSGARLAIKIMTARLSPALAGCPLDRLETVAADLTRPRLPRGLEHLFCSAAHDSKFAFAAAARTPVGVDVEALGERVARARGAFVTDQEEEAIRLSEAGEAGGALRLWSIKESGAKAMGLNLPEALDRVRVGRLDRLENRALVAGREARVVHLESEGHLFTLLRLSGPAATS